MSEQNALAYYRETTSKEKLLSVLSGTRIPSYMHDGLVHWILDGRGTGHFLMSIFRNDLKEACNRADDENRHLLYDYVYFLYNHAPMACWGSEANVKQWRDWGQELQGGAPKDRALPLAVLFLLLFPVVSAAQVYTNDAFGKVVKIMRPRQPAAPVPQSIKESARETALQVSVSGWSVRTMRSTERMADQRVESSAGEITRLPRRDVSGPVFVDGLYVGDSPTGWTAITTKIPTVRVIR